MHVPPEAIGSHASGSPPGDQAVHWSRTQRPDPLTAAPQKSACERRPHTLISAVTGKCSWAVWALSGKAGFAETNLKQLRNQMKFRTIPEVPGKCHSTRLRAGRRSACRRGTAGRPARRGRAVGPRALRRGRSLSSRAGSALGKEGASVRWAQTRLAASPPSGAHTSYNGPGVEVP